MLEMERGPKIGTEVLILCPVIRYCLTNQLLIVSIDPGVNSNHIISIEGDRINSTFLTGCISSISKSLTGVPLPGTADCPIYRIYPISHSTLAKMHPFRDFNGIKKGVNSWLGSFVAMRGRTGDS
jgi:hypothetical protein